MAVTLERVQFKFASIIGELCSEPLILSQFAVWVDMRLAEYKLKGSISLDCSGDLPDPVWLKGITSALIAKLKQIRPHTTSPSIGQPRPRAVRSDGSFGSSPRNIPRGQNSFSGERLTDAQGVHVSHSTLSQSSHASSPEQQEIHLPPDVIVKAEPEDDQDIFPVTLHRHESASPGRKRPAAETITSETSNSAQTGSSMSPSHLHTIAKVRRVSAGLANTSSFVPDSDPSNVSLMSIIGMDLQDQGHDSSSASFGNIDDDISIIMASEASMQEHRGDDFALQGNDSAHNDSLPGEDGPADTYEPLVINLHTPHMHAKRRTVESLSGKKSTTAAKTRSHVKMFQQWLANQPEPDVRKIEDIPPVELDAFLELFFATVKSRSGEEYGPSSLKSLRQSLERHLKEANYPASITTSTVFFGSRLVYKNRMLLGKNKARSEMVP